MDRTTAGLVLAIGLGLVAAASGIASFVHSANRPPAASASVPAHAPAEPPLQPRTLRDRYVGDEARLIADRLADLNRTLERIERELRGLKSAMERR